MNFITTCWQINQSQNEQQQHNNNNTAADADGDEDENNMSSGEQTTAKQQAPHSFLIGERDNEQMGAAGALASIAESMNAAAIMCNQNNTA